MSILESIISVLLCALFITVLFRRFHVPVLLGYFLVGILLGPHALDLIPNLHTINELAEFGIVFLMFTVGLEFSQSKLFALKRAVFLIGSLQVGLSMALTMVAAILIGMNIQSALIIGGIVAMSSTAIVIKQLNDQIELHSPHGLNAVGILLFQDLAVIPLIILILGISQAGHHSLTLIFLLALLKGILAIIVISIAGKWVLRPIFHIISNTRAIELFTLTVLLIALTAAWLTNVLGLSYALGAFLAGIMLGGTEFKHQIEIEIRPFRDILLGLFFITIGMLANMSQWQSQWEWITILLTAIVFGKMLLIIAISRWAGNNSTVSLRTGLVLAQGGEFGFAILTLALSRNMLPPEYSQVVLAALLISMGISPIFICLNQRIAAWLLPKETLNTETSIQQEIAKTAKELKDHVIICGYGRVGQQVAKLLDKTGVAYIGLDIDSELIQRASLAGNRVIYGDASHPGILQAAGLNHAKALVLSFDDLKSSIKVLSMARPLYPTLPILVRCKDEFEISQLKEYGATQIIAEIFEESLTISYHLLQIIKIAPERISELMHEVRDKDYDQLRKVFSGSFENEPIGSEFSLHEQLIPILIPKGAYAVNHRLGEFDFKSIGVEVIAIRRGQLQPAKPRGNMKIRPNDILVLYGPLTNIEDAEQILLGGY